MENIEKIKEIGVLKKYRKNQWIYHNGDVADSIYLVLAGKVKTFHHQENIECFVTGGIFGEEVLSRDRTRVFDAKAEDAVAVLTIDYSNIEKFIAFEPRYTMLMMEKLAETYFKTREKIHIETPDE